MASTTIARPVLTNKAHVMPASGKNSQKHMTNGKRIGQARSVVSKRETEDMATTGFGHELKLLRERAHLKQNVCAKTLGVSPGGYANYENEARYKDQPIPASVIVKLVPLFVGRGEPPIETREMLAISDVSGIQNLLTGATDRPVRAAPLEMGELTVHPNALMVRYSIERGVFRDATAFEQANKHGRSTAPVLPLRNYPQSAQWGAIIVDGSGQKIGLPRHTLLQCVDVSALTPADMPKGSVVVCSRTKDTLTEIVLCVIEDYGIRGYTLKDAVTSQKTEAEVLGAAVYRYGPVAQA